MFRMHGLAQLVVVGAVYFAGFTVARGAASNWTDSGGGLWNDPANWSAGVATTIATFNLANTYTVTFDVSPTISTLDMQNGTVTFALAGHTLTTTSASSDIGGADNGQTRGSRS